MSDKKCPNCGLWNSQEAIRCDCGFNFLASKVDERYAPKKPEVNQFSSAPSVESIFENPTNSLSKNLRSSFEKSTIDHTREYFRKSFIFFIPFCVLVLILFIIHLINPNFVIKEPINSMILMVTVYIPLLLSQIYWFWKGEISLGLFSIKGNLARSILLLIILFLLAFPLLMAAFWR